MQNAHGYYIPDDAAHERRPHNVAPTLSSVHVLFTVKDFGRDIGICNIGLGVTAVNCIKTLRYNGVYAEMASVNSAQEIHKELEQRTHSRYAPVSHVIVSSPSWVQPDDFRRLCLRWPEVEFVLLEHSGCTYLSIDKFGIRNVRELAKYELLLHNMRIGANNPRVARFMTVLTNRDCLLLPNMYDITSFVTPYNTQKLNATLRVGSFGAARPWKNQLVAAEAAVMLARKLGMKLEFYVNSKRPEGNWRMIESRNEIFHQLPGCRVIEVPWEPWPAFRQTIGNMHLLFSPSFDETFNVVTADGIAEGTPSVVGASIEWVPTHWMAETFDPEDVSRIGTLLLHDPRDAVEAGRKQLRTYVKSSVLDWINYLTKRSLWPTS